MFLQPDLLRKFDPMPVMNERLPTPRRMTDDQRADAIQALKNTMAITRGETDPATTWTRPRCAFTISRAA